MWVSHKPGGITFRLARGYLQSVTTYKPVLNYTAW